MSSLICGGHTSSHKLRPGAITSAFHRQSGKHGHLLYVGGGILSGKRLYALDTIQSVSSGFVCMALVHAVYGASVCVYQKARKRRVSVGSSGTGLAHRQTNTLHYRPIYLIN